MNIEKQIVKKAKKEIKQLWHASAEDRGNAVKATALGLVALVLFSSTELAHSEDKRNLNRLSREAIVARTAVLDPFNLDPSEKIGETVNSAEKNETVRMPVKFEDGLSATLTTGA